MAGDYTVIEWDDKDPSEVINDGVDFGPGLDTGDSVIAAPFTFIGSNAGLVLTNPRLIGNRALVTVSGGTDGLSARILCTASTQGGETLKQVIKLKVKAKI